MEVYFSLGTNQGDRNANILRALEMMDEAFGCHYSSLSSIIETEPWGFSSDLFLNCAVRYDLPLEIETIETQSLDLLDKVKEIERSLGRREKIEFDENGNRIYHARVIDIDILLIGDERIDTERLTVPHPLMYKRDFVVVPLREIMPDLSDKEPLA